MRSPTDKPALIRRALRQCAMCCSWPDIVIDRLVESAQLRAYAQHVQIPTYRAGDKQVLIVASGSLEVQRLSQDGLRFLLSVLGPGEITALTNLLDTVELSYAFQARNTTSLVHLPVGRLREILDDHPLLWRDVALMALTRQQGNINMLQRQALATLPQKIAQALIRLAQWSGTRLDRPEGMTLRVSQADVAAMLAVTRQTVNKEMQVLVQLGLVSVAYGRLMIHDLAGLRRLAEDESLLAKEASITPQR